MTTFRAEAEVKLESPEQCAMRMCEHFGEHDYAVSREGRRHRIAFPAGLGFLEIGSDRIRMEATADDAGALHLIRLSLASHLTEFAPAGPPEIVWSGDLSDILVPPNFRDVAVKCVRTVTPHMRRITLTGEDLGRFSAFDIHLKLLIPRPGGTPRWPVVGRNGMLVWPEGEDRPHMRTYTIRRIDPAAGELDVDMLAHEGTAGPGARFAATARAGDRIGIIGPGGRNAQPADWHLLAGDETALPAIGRILEGLPPAARGHVLIEVGSAAERQDLVHPLGFTIEWLDRRGAEPGTTSLLADAVKGVALPSSGSVFAWAGAEFAAFKAIREHWRRNCGLPNDRHLCVSYWRRGVSEGARTAPRHA